MSLIISLKVINHVEDLKHYLINILDLTPVSIRYETNLIFLWDVIILDR